MPQRRGSALPMKATFNPEGERLSQSFPFGLRVADRTGEASAGASPAAGFGLDALGLRISRLLRFCDFAMSECSLSVTRFG